MSLRQLLLQYHPEAKYITTMLGMTPLCKIPYTALISQNGHTMRLTLKLIKMTCYTRTIIHAISLNSFNMQFFSV